MKGPNEGMPILFPKITIVTPNLNMEKYLEQTITSVLEQGYPNLEYLIIDGGSKDESIAIINKYKDLLSYWVSEPDGGLYQAIQKGFDRSTGEIMMWLNSDDMLHPNALFTVAEIFTSITQVEWLTGTPTNFDEAGRTVEVIAPRQWSKYHFYSRDFKWIQQESTAWRRSLWQRAGSNLSTKFQYAADFELWIRFFRSSKLYSTTALIGGFRKRRSGQISSSHLIAYLNECEDVLSEEISALDDEDARKLKIYRVYRYIVSLARKSKILNTAAADRFVMRCLNEQSPILAFNPNTQKFEIRS